MVEAQCQRFEVRSTDGEQVLFSADEEEISIGTEKLRVTGRGHNACSSATSSATLFPVSFFYMTVRDVFGFPLRTILTRALEPISFVLRRHVPEDKKKTGQGCQCLSLFSDLQVAVTRGAAEHR